MVIQTLIPEASVEAFDEGVLSRFAGLDQLELNAMLAGSLIQCLAGKFRPLVGSNSFGIATEASCLIKDTRHVMP